MKNKKNKVLNMNLGCGSHIVEGKDWVNVDNYLLADVPNFVQADILDLPFESNTVDYIICDQVLEHVAMKDIPTALFNIKRVLKKGGKAVIVVPDFRGAAEQWLALNHNENFEPLSYHYFSEVIYGNQKHAGEFHKTPMSAGYLNYVLNMVGLVNHELIAYPAFGVIPDYPGMRPYVKEARCRNEQLVAVITK